MIIHSSLQDSIPVKKCSNKSRYKSENQAMSALAILQKWKELDTTKQDDEVSVSEFRIGERRNSADFMIQKQKADRLNEEKLMQERENAFYIRKLFVNLKCLYELIGKYNDWILENPFNKDTMNVDNNKEQSKAPDCCKVFLNVENSMFVSKYPAILDYSSCLEEFIHISQRIKDNDIQNLLNSKLQDNVGTNDIILDKMIIKMLVYISNYCIKNFEISRDTSDMYVGFVDMKLNNNLMATNNENIDFSNQEMIDVNSQKNNDLVEDATKEDKCVKLDDRLSDSTNDTSFGSSTYTTWMNMAKDLNIWNLDGLEKAKQCVWDLIHDLNLNDDALKEKFNNFGIVIDSKQSQYGFMKDNKWIDISEFLAFVCIAGDVYKLVNNIIFSISISRKDCCDMASYVWKLINVTDNNDKDSFIHVVSEILCDNFNSLSKYINNNQNNKINADIKDQVVDEIMTNMNNYMGRIGISYYSSNKNINAFITREINEFLCSDIRKIRMITDGSIYKGMNYDLRHAIGLYRKYLVGGDCTTKDMFSYIRHVFKTNKEISDVK